MSIGLVRHGCDLNKTDKEGRSALCIAAASGDKAIVSCLLQAGADKDQAQKDGRSPLWIAATAGCEEVVRCLLDAGADQKASNDGSSPLLLAAMEGHSAVARALLAAGANKDKGYDGARDAKEKMDTALSLYTVAACRALYIYIYVPQATLILNGMEQAVCLGDLGRIIVS